MKGADRQYMANKIDGKQLTVIFASKLCRGWNDVGKNESLGRNSKCVEGSASVGGGIGWRGRGVRRLMRGTSEGDAGHEGM